MAILSFDSFRKKDIDEFDRLTGTTGPQVKRVKVKGGTPIGDGESEVDLDIDAVRSIAPKAQILNYEGPNGDASFADMMERIGADGRADIVS